MVVANAGGISRPGGSCGRAEKQQGQSPVPGSALSSCSAVPEPSCPHTVSVWLHIAVLRLTGQAGGKGAVASQVPACASEAQSSPAGSFGGCRGQCCAQEAQGLPLAGQECRCYVLVIGANTSSALHTAAEKLLGTPSSLGIWRNWGLGFPLCC